jgi:hypothetical protein
MKVQTNLRAGYQVTHIIVGGLKYTSSLAAPIPIVYKYALGSTRCAGV